MYDFCTIYNNSKFRIRKMCDFSTIYNFRIQKTYNFCTIYNNFKSYKNTINKQFKFVF